MIVRIISPGWENFTGPLGQYAKFVDGVSTTPLTVVQIRRIGVSLQIVNHETGEQLGPAAEAARSRFDSAVVTPQLETQVETDKRVADDRARLAADETARKAAEAEALAEAQRKAQEQVESQVIYSRTELEAIGATNGIGGLREIATPLGVRARSISEMVTAILEAQAKLTVTP